MNIGVICSREKFTEIGVKRQHRMARQKGSGIIDDLERDIGIASRSMFS